MGMSLSMAPRQEQRQEMRLEQRLALQLKQELQLKMSLKQVLELVQKLWPQLTQKLGLKMERGLKRILSGDRHLQTELGRYLSYNTEPTAMQLQTNFPQLAPVFNEYYRETQQYGYHLRRGDVVVPRKTPEQRRETQRGPRMEMSLRMMPALQQAIAMPPTNWSFADAFEDEGTTGCKLPSKRLEGLEGLSLDERLRKIDEANELFRFAYAKEGKKYFKIPLVRNVNIEPDDIAVRITKKEHDYAKKVIAEAGRIQRIARAVPYREIREALLDHLGENDVDLEDTVVIGVDRGGRLPTHIIKEALGIKQAYFLKVDQGMEQIDDARFQKMIDSGILKGKYAIFVDSTVDSGRQISALRKYMDDEDVRKDIGHKGWVVAGSNETGITLDNHLNIDWGLDPDESFEDNPNLMGVDYARETHKKIRVQPTEMSNFIRDSIRAVSRGYVLDTSAVKGQMKPEKKAETAQETADADQQPDKKKVAAQTAQQPKQSAQPYAPKKLLIIGDGQNRTMTEKEAELLALRLEHGFEVFAGTPQGNPGYLLELISEYVANPGVRLFQPAYTKGQNGTNGFQVVYKGKTKDAFRDAMIKEAEVVLALGGNTGTYAEIQKALAAGLPTVVVKGSGYAGITAEQKNQGDPNLHLVSDLEAAANKVRLLK